MRCKSHPRCGFAKARTEHRPTPFGLPTIRQVLANLYLDYPKLPVYVHVDIDETAAQSVSQCHCVIERKRLHQPCCPSQELTNESKPPDEVRRTGSRSDGDEVIDTRSPTWTDHPAHLKETLRSVCPVLQTSR